MATLALRDPTQVKWSISACRGLLSMAREANYGLRNDKQYNLPSPISFDLMSSMSCGTKSTGLETALYRF